MIGVELVESKESRKPLAKELFQRIWNETKDRGVLFGNGGMNGNVWSPIYRFITHPGNSRNCFCFFSVCILQILRIKPPMCINRSDVDVAVDTLDQSIRAVLLDRS